MKSPVMTIHDFARLGGHARAAKLSPSQRRKAAQKAANARWAKYRAKRAA